MNLGIVRVAGPIDCVEKPSENPSNFAQDRVKQKTPCQMTGGLMSLSPNFDQIKLMIPISRSEDVGVFVMIATGTIRLGPLGAVLVASP